jgi:CheY-like chemotaxis protein
MALKVLVVDDDPAIVEVVEQVLVEEGFLVQHAHDGREALFKIKQVNPDVVLSDVKMPALDGLTLANVLRESGDNTPVVLMSAIYSDVDLPRVRFIPKPFDVDQLVCVVKRAAQSGNGSWMHA